MRVHIGRQSLLENHNRRQHESHRPQAKRGEPEEVHRLGRIAAEQLHRDQVEHHTRSTRQGVFGLAIGPGAVVDGEFGDPGPDHRRVHRDEAVHLAVEPHVLDDVAAIGLQRAAEVAQMNARHVRDDPVRDLRRQHAGDVIAAVMPPPADHVVALVDLFEQVRDVVRVVLHVAVEKHEPGRRRSARSCGES